MADYSRFFPQEGSGTADYSQFFPPEPNIAVTPSASSMDRGYIPNDLAPPVQRRPNNPLLMIPGAVEAGISMGATALTAPVAGIAGVLSNLTSGKFGTPEGIQIANKTAGDIMQNVPYRPRLQEGQAILSGAGRLLSESKLAGLGPSEAVPLGVLAGPAMNQAKGIASNALQDVLHPGPAEIPGFGAAMTGAERMRQERAAALPIPVQLTKGQITRDMQQLQFERETAKTAVGAPLLERGAQQNQAFLRNFDDFVDQTGAQAPDLRATGQIVNSAIVDKAAKAKAAIKSAYASAEASGEMSQPVNVQPLLDYAAAKRPEAINAPVISSLEAKLKAVAGAGNTVSINDLEEVRKMIGTLGGKDATNAYFSKEIKGLIDNITEGAGGDSYARARALRSRYARDFENVGVVDKLMSTKPGTTDRAVAYEDVFKHSVLSGSLDDVRAIRKTLQGAGHNGDQAWKELQGQTVLYLKNEATKNAQRDISGNPIVSFSGFDKAVRNLDADGKLDFVFGQSGAQQIRDMRDLSSDVFTAPPGAVNTSNTNNAFWQMMGSLPGAKQLRIAKDLWGSRQTRARVQEALAPGMSQQTPDERATDRRR